MISEMIDMLAMAFLIGLTGALAPGPTLVATVNSSLKTGWIAGPKIALGHAMVELLIFILIVMGLAATAQQQQAYSHYIAIVGGLALIAFGILTVKGSRNASLVSTTENKTGNPYIAGILTSAANPYFWVWWLSVGSALVIDGLRGGFFWRADHRYCPHMAQERVELQFMVTLRPKGGLWMVRQPRITPVVSAAHVD